MYYVEIICKGFKERFKTNSNDLEELYEIYGSFFHVGIDEIEIRFITKEEFLESED